MSHLVQSLEHVVEAGVKGIIGLAEGYMSGTCPSQGETSASGAGTDEDVKPTASGQEPQPINISTSLLPPPLSTLTAGNSSNSSPSARPPQSLASRLALAQDTLVQVTDISSGWIHLQSTYLDSEGGQRKVRSFGLRNVSQATIDVEVASDLEDHQVVFWVADEGEPDTERNPSQSSSSSAAGSSIASTASPAFTLKLLAGESRTVFLAFQPSTSQPSTPAGTSTPSSEGGFTPRVAPMAASSELSPPPGGKLPPAASSSSTGASLKSESTLASTSVSSSTLSVGSNSAGRKQDPIHRSFSVHGSILVHATTAEDDITNPPAQQNVTVPFFATVCRSFFSLGVIDPTSGLASGSQITKGELAIDFGTDVVVGQDVHRDLLLVNRSEIDLVWTTSVTNSPFKDSVWFLLRDLDSENVFGVDTSSEPVPLPPLSSRHLRLTLRAEAPVANFEFEFRLSNSHQTGNAVLCRAVGSCHTEASDDTLRILSGSALDFGQVPDGTWAKKLISCKNSGDRPIDVHFSASEGYEVVFRLAGVAGEDIDEDMPAMRPARDKRMEALSRTSTRDTRESRPRDLSGARPPTESDDWFEQANANGLIDPTGSMPSSRPLSRVTSIASSSRPLREDPDSDDDDSVAASAIPDLRPSDNLGDRDIPNQIEELTMRPGTEYRVFAMYRPTRDLNSPPEIAGALRAASFKVFLDSIPSTQRSRPIPRSRKVIHCTAESCTSIIAIPSGHVIDFGEVTVGASKSTTIAIQNLSALSARVEIAAISKVLNTNRNVIIIPPFETVQERIDFFPRRINDKYEKQVFVRNHLNRANNQLIEVHSKNVDVYNVTLHSHLYRILTPGGSNFLDFGNVVINSPSIRTVQFQNLTHRPLTLDLSASHPEDLELYIKDTDAPQVPVRSADVSTSKLALPADDRPQNGNLKERFVESLQDKDSSESKEKTKATARHKTVKKVHKDDDKRDIGTTLVAALKKGSRGKHVQLYNDAVVFKDRSLLDDLEFLDLASGPPLAASRTPASSKRIHMLETIAFEDKSKLSGQHPKALKLDFAASAKSSGLVSKENREGRLRKAKSSAGSSRRDPSTRRTADPSTPTKQVAKNNATPPSPSSAQRTPVVKQQQQQQQQQQQLMTKSPALTGRRLEPKSDPACLADVTKLTPHELLAAIEHMDAKRSSASVTHLSPEEEEQYVRRLLDLRKELRSSIAAGKFVPAKVLTVPPGASRQLVVVMTPNGATRPHVTTRAKRCEQRIVIKLLEYDHSLLSGVMGAHCDLSELPVRDLVIRSSCVRSVLEVQQSSINFGTCDRGEVKSRMIVIHNRSDCVGVYRLRTSGSIASGNLKLGLGRYGVVSAFGRKEVASFSFTPSLVGNYNETIAVENVLDSHNNQNVLVKATVRKMPTFSLDATKLDFAPTQTNSWPASAGFVITNTSKTERTFVVEVAAPADSAFAELSLSRDEKDAGVALSRGEEEEVEGLLQKLKIARRKNKPDKIAKYEKRLGELGVTTASTEEAALATTPDEEIAEMSIGAFTPAAGELASTPTIQVTLGASKKAKVLVALLPRPGNEPFSTAIKVYERKNTDETVMIEVNASPHVAPAAPTPSPPASPEDPLNLAIMKHALELTLKCPVSPTAFCVGSTLFLPRSSPLYDALTPHFPTFPDPVTGESAGLVLADGYSRQIPGNTHAEANALANFRERMGELESAEAKSAGNEAPSETTTASPIQSQEGAGYSGKTQLLPSTDDILTQAACYATMEPCSVRTSGGPSCALELVRAHVKEVYLGVEEPPDFVQCEGVRILEQGGVEVRRVVGLEEECLRLARRGRT